MREEGRADTSLTLHVVTHIHMNTPVLTDGCLTVSNGLMPLTGRTQVRDPHQPSGQGKLCTEDSQQWELGSQRLAGKTEKQVGTWIQNSGREEIRNTSYCGGKRSPGCHGDESQRGNRQPLPPRGQL